MNIIEAIHDPKLFRPCFKSMDTWTAWEALLRGFFGLDMDAEQLNVFQQYTTRTERPKGAFKELWACCGRRSGKSFMAALIAVYLALFHKYEEFLAPGEKGYVVIVAADRSQASTILNYCRGILKGNPLFAAYLVEDLKESLHLSNNVVIEIHSCSYKSVRGRTVIACLLDEICFWRDMGANPDAEVLSALRPCLATIPTSKIIAISSPYSKRGVMFEVFRDYHGSADSEILTWQAPTRMMNPSVSQSLIDKETAKDASSARSEWQAEWRDDLEQFLSAEQIALCANLPGELGPDPHVVYSSFVDGSGGRKDSFTAAVGHTDRVTGRLVVDSIRGWQPPFSPDVVVREVAELFKRYRVGRTCGDRYSAEWIVSAFLREGIFYEACELSKSDLYMGLEGIINTERIQFQNHSQLVAELTNLERRHGRSGKDIVDHMVRGSDDYSNSLAGLCHVLTSMQNSAFRNCDLR
jgi:hypothetical protein